MIARIESMGKFGDTPAGRWAVKCVLCGLPTIARPPLLQICAGCRWWPGYGYTWSPPAGWWPL